VRLDVTASNCIPPPLQHTHTCKHMTLTFDPITLKASSAMVGHVMNIYAEFHWYYSTKYRDTASRKL